MGRNKDPQPEAPAYDPLKPPLVTLVKLGAIAVHADEYFSPDGHPVDKDELLRLIQDGDVQKWLVVMSAQALIPLKRNA